ncbi:hypothetical protein ACP70R_036479 [Stipagrostis hirtigluma subsp. patula]
MEGDHGKPVSETASVIEVAREPAIIINGVPDLPSDCTSVSQPEVQNDAESQVVDPRFGEWLEGRKVRKLFGDTYYIGKVVKYDSESNWYSIVYDDGDQEDLEWRELEEVLLPLDITIPLKTLVMNKCRLQGTVPDHRTKVGRPRKVYVTIDDSAKKTSNNVPALHPTSTSNAEANLQASNQPRKRGRPRKDQTVSTDNQPKKRGRPPKNRSTESTPDSLALVSVHDDSREASNRQNSTLKRNAMTARAEKLKREHLRVQGTTPGTRLF